MTPKNTPDARLGEIGGIIRRARADMGSGNPVDLDGLDDTIQALCAAVAELPREQADALRPRLVGLKDELDALEQSVRQAHAEFGRELKAVSTRSQALTAYTRPPSDEK